MKQAQLSIDEVVAEVEFTSLKKKEDKFDYLVDAGIKSAEAKKWLALNTTAQREIDYTRLVQIFIENIEDKKLACRLAAQEDVCSLKTAEHLWSAIKFAREWSKQAI